MNLDVNNDPNAVDHDLFYTPELLGQECCYCYRVLRYSSFARDTSYRSGHKPQCLECQNAPRLSMAEHTSRLKGLNYNSEAVKRQRHEDQEEFRKRDVRTGRQIHCSDLLLKLHKLVPSLYVKEGGFVKDVALYQVAETPQEKWDGKNFRYLGFATYDFLPEYSIYEFDEARDILVRVSEQGWRDVLLRFIKAGLLTVEQADKEFGKATGQASTVWHKQLWHLRNSAQVA